MMTPLQRARGVLYFFGLYYNLLEIGTTKKLRGAQMGEATLKGLNAKQVGLIIAVMAVYFFAPTQGIISSVLGEIGKSYPNISDATLTYLITLNNIMAVPAAFFFGLWAGRKFKFKTLSIIAMLCFIVGGGLPVFLPQNAPFWIMFSTRGIIGLGRGCFIPIVQITLSAMFRDEKTRSAWFGFGSVLFNLGATFGVAIAGILAVFDWRYCFAFYLFAAIPLGLYAIFFHEEDVSDYIASTESGMKAFKFPGICWAYFVLYALAIIISQTMFNYGGLTMSHLGFSTVQSGFRDWPRKVIRGCRQTAMVIHTPPTVKAMALARPAPMTPIPAPGMVKLCSNSSTCRVG